MCVYIYAVYFDVLFSGDLLQAALKVALRIVNSGGGDDDDEWDRLCQHWKGLEYGESPNDGAGRIQ